MYAIGNGSLIMNSLHRNIRANRTTILNLFGRIGFFVIFVLVLASTASLMKAFLVAFLFIFVVIVITIYLQRTPGQALAPTVQKFLSTIGATKINQKTNFDPPEEGLFDAVELDVLLSYTQLKSDQKIINFSYGAIRIAPGDFAFLFFLQTKMESSLPGSIQLRPRRSRFIQYLVTPVKTESVHINEEVDILAYPKKLAFQVFPPDFLDWYNNLPVRPWIIVRNDKLTVVYEGAKDLQYITKTVEWFKTITKYVQRSGALEKAKSLIPPV